MAGLYDSANVPHFPVHSHGSPVTLSNEQIHKPSVLLLASSLERFRKILRQAQASVLRSDGERSDVSVPWHIVIRELEVDWVFFDFAHHYVSRMSDQLVRWHITDGCQDGRVIRLL